MLATPALWLERRTGHGRYARRRDVGGGLAESPRTAADRLCTSVARHDGRIVQFEIHASPCLSLTGRTITTVQSMRQTLVMIGFFARMHLTVR
jgi:hypothetical protein